MNLWNKSRKCDSVFPCMPLSEKAWVPNSFISFFEKNWETNRKMAGRESRWAEAGCSLYFTVWAVGPGILPQLCAALYTAVNSKRERGRVSLLGKQDRNKYVLVSGYSSLTKNIKWNRNFTASDFFHHESILSVPSLRNPKCAVSCTYVLHSCFAQGPSPGVVVGTWPRISKFIIPSAAQTWLQEC